MTITQWCLQHDIAYFAWVKQNISNVTAKGKTHNGFSYSINQEKYLRVFLENEEFTVPQHRSFHEVLLKSGLSDRLELIPLFGPYSWQGLSLFQRMNHINGQRD